MPNLAAARPGAAPSTKGQASGCLKFVALAALVISIFSALFEGAIYYWWDTEKNSDVGVGVGSRRSTPT